MKKAHNLNEYTTADHALMYLSRADSTPHRSEGGAVLLDFIPQKELHNKFVHALGLNEGEEDPSNILLEVETQLQWLRSTLRS